MAENGNGVELAKAYVQIIPSMEGIQDKLKEALGGAGGQGGEDAGKAFGGAFEKGLTAAFDKAKDFIIDSVQTGMGFDSAMSQVAATMGKTVGEISELRDYAKEMGAATAFSATQSAEALNFMALAGYDAQTSMEMLPKVMNLASAGGMELARASDMITDSQTALGLTLEQTDILVDQMAKTASTTNTSVSQLGDAILTVGSTAKQLKGGTNEINQMLGLMADNGIKAGEAGTHLRNIILAMNPTTKDAREAFAELNFEAYDSQGNLRAMSDIFAELSEKTAEMTQQERQDIIGKMFKITDLAAVNALLDTNAERWDEVAAAIDDAQGSAQAMADTQLDNLQGDITLMKSAFEGLQIAISDEITPDLRELVQTATKGLKWATEHVHTIIGAVEALGVAAAAMKLPAVIGAVKTAITAANTAMTAFNGTCAMNPIVAAFEAAVAAGLLLKGVIDDCTDAINEIPDAYEGLNEQETEFVKSLAEATDDLAEATERRETAEKRLNSAKENRAFTEKLFNEYAEEYRAIMDKETTSLEEINRANEIQNELLPQLREKYQEQNARVGELSAAYVTAKHAEDDLLETQEKETAAAEEQAAADEEAAKAARELAEAQQESLDKWTAKAETAFGGLKTALKDTAEMQVTLKNKTVKLSEETAVSMGEIIDQYNEMYEAQKKALESSVDMFGSFTADTTTTFDDLFSNLQETNYYLNDWATAIEQLEARGLGEGIVQSLKDMGTDSWSTVYALNHATDAQLAQYTKLWEDTESDMNDITDSLTANEKSEAEKALNELSGLAGLKLEDYEESFEKLGLGSGGKFKDSITGKFEEAYETIDKMTEEEIQELVNKRDDWVKVGDNFPIGVSTGIEETAVMAADAAYDMAAAMKTKAEEALGIASPSKVGKEIGGYFSEGVGEGIEDETDTAVKAAEKMAETVIDSVDLSDIPIGFGTDSTAEDIAKIRSETEKYKRGREDDTDGTAPAGMPAFFNVDLLRDVIALMLANKTSLDTQNERLGTLETVLNEFSVQIADKFIVPEDMVLNVTQQIDGHTFADNTYPLFKKKMNEEAVKARNSMAR